MHAIHVPRSVIWQHRNAPRWAWRDIWRHVVQVVRGRGHSSGMEQRTNIKFCFKLRKTAAETVEMMRQVYGDNFLSCAQIFRWYARFKSGVETIEDEARPGRPFSVRNEGLIAKVRERIQEEHFATVRMMADEFGVNRETIRQILVKDLGKRQVASRFVLHSLSDDQRHECVQYAKDIIKLLVEIKISWIRL